MRILLIALLFLASILIPVHAHHSSAGRYDSSDIMEVEGNILDVRWRNPHAHLNILMEDESGREVEWEVEGTSPSDEVVLVEQFTPVEQGSRLDYQLTVTNPAMYMEPVYAANNGSICQGRKYNPTSASKPVKPCPSELPGLV